MQLPPVSQMHSRLGYLFIINIGNNNIYGLLLLLLFLARNQKPAPFCFPFFWGRMLESVTGLWSDWPPIDTSVPSFVASFFLYSSFCCCCCCCCCLATTIVRRDEDKMSRSGGGGRRRGGNGSKKEEEEEGDVCLLVLLRCHQWRADGGRHSRHPIPQSQGCLLVPKNWKPQLGKDPRPFFPLCFRAAKEKRMKRD